MQIRNLGLIVLLIGFSAWGVANGQLTPAQRVAPAKVAVVDMASVFNRAQMVLDLERIFGQERLAIQNEVNSRKERLAKVQKELNSGAFAKDSSDYIEREDSATKQQFDNEFWLRKKERTLRADHKRWFEDIYKRVVAATQDIARQNGVDIVLTNNPVDFNVPSSDALVAQILQKKVVYASPHVDLTEAVMATLDKQYQRDGGSSMIQLAK